MIRSGAFLPRRHEGKEKCIVRRTILGWTMIGVEEESFRFINYLDLFDGQGHTLFWLRGLGMGLAGRNIGG
jgi:hypothetical protein